MRGPPIRKPTWLLHRVAAVVSIAGLLCGLGKSSEPHLCVTFAPVTINLACTVDYSLRAVDAADLDGIGHRYSPSDGLSTGMAMGMADWWSVGCVTGALASAIIADWSGRKMAIVTGAFRR